MLLVLMSERKEKRKEIMSVQMPNVIEGHDADISVKEKVSLIERNYEPTFEESLFTFILVFLTVIVGLVNVVVGLIRELHRFILGAVRR